AEAALTAIFAAGPIPEATDEEPAVDAGPLVVIEERLFGPEASLIAVCDGRTALALPAARDHKRLADADQGPNTGGMGAYSPLPDLPDAAVEMIIRTVHQPLLAELARRGSPFRGALYAGLILTADGPVLLECNARFGDPETQVILPLLAVPLGPLLRAAALRELAGALAELGLDPAAARIPVLPGAAVGIVLAAAGYPGMARHGDEIGGLAEDGGSVAGPVGEEGGVIFHSGTSLDADGHFRTSGGRVLTAVGRGRDLATARGAAEALAESISFAGLQRRHDIAAGPGPIYVEVDEAGRLGLGVPV
ncbi:MAG: phosphoribosylamine--glycine ligase, partial [Candidatus Limnocylindrales bacterium]